MKTIRIPRRLKVIAAYIGIGLLVVVVAGLAFIASRPAEFRIERSAVVVAPPDVVFAMINDFHKWVEWSPYEKFDPDMKKTFTGPSAGPGANYAWSGNSKAGEGQITILESKPGELVRMQLEFTRPFACQNEVNFKLVPSAGGTQVSWIMDGKNNFVGKAFSTFMNMDAMVGKEFENGLANLDTLAQAESQKRR
jgi:hypothetical protein